MHVLEFYIMPIDGISNVTFNKIYPVSLYNGDWIQHSNSTFNPTWTEKQTRDNYIHQELYLNMSPINSERWRRIYLNVRQFGEREGFRMNIHSIHSSVVRVLRRWDAAPSRGEHDDKQSQRDGVIPDAPVRSVSYAVDKNYIQPVTLTTR